MITAAELLSYMRESTYKPLNAEELIHALQVKDIQEFIALLRDMESRGLIVFTRKNRYGLPERMGLIPGRFQGHAKGFGFLIPDNPEQNDIFISADNTSGAMHNDRIMVRVMKQVTGVRQEGEVIRILERANNRVVGTFEDARRYGFVRPDEKRLAQDIFVPKESFNGARDGDKVIVEVTKWPEPRRNPEGKVAEVFGRAGAPGIDVLSIIKKFQLPEEFPENVIREAEKVAVIRPEDYQGRRDLRSLPMVTIDGEDAKDLDDAVSLELLANGNWYLGVHIADVGNYVKEDSFLDREAFQRGTSVYMVDRVIPMLPRQLSNDICSLNAGVDRLAMTCFMEINPQGSVVAHDITPSVIQVRERMTYSNVNKILLQNDLELKKRYEDFVAMFKNMAMLMHTLRQKRMERGAINFEFPEAKVILDERGKPEAIVKRTSDVAEQMIEEFMIAANETVASEYYWREAPFLYRIHEVPDPEKVEELNEFLHRFGYHIKGASHEIHPKVYQDIIDKIEGRPEERVISTVMLRSMRHARYHPEALGHFGLASKYYSHFTSPIRRYPDLVIHRVIKEYLAKGQLNEERRTKLRKRMNDYAEQSSFKEKIAEDAERESLDMKKAEFMERHIGDTFEGIISGVTSFGMFVELDNTVEGLVHVSTMTDDYYQFEEKLIAFRGRHTRKMYKLGDAVKIVVSRVNVEDRSIDFELAADE
ncbi:ribonuclease R [Candidatus Formimonas warabiya]|uniref:Ribonuclease R n=1 Tax=Formimonas warabiya TaxID=1761012 RepID=A0A3G1KTI9_FORW1|nr:ribonuclease R [Candidatus Formimonas warabiya]ATW25823.1 ribonuclease R [Candidatus Formimonas warabiya]